MLHPSTQRRHDMTGTRRRHTENRPATVKNNMQSIAPMEYMAYAHLVDRLSLPGLHPTSNPGITCHDGRIPWSLRLWLDLQDPSISERCTDRISQRRPCRHTCSFRARYRPRASTNQMPTQELDDGTTTTTTRGERRTTPLGTTATYAT